VNTALTSSSIRVGDVARVDVEVLIGRLSSGASFTLTIQDSVDGVTFQNVATAALSVANPWPITSNTATLTRFTYSGNQPYIRVSIASTVGANPSLWISVRALRTAGQVSDELTLANLTRLCKYGILRRLLGTPISDALTLLQLSGIDPFSTTGGPRCCAGAVGRARCADGARHVDHRWRSIAARPGRCGRRIRCRSRQARC
jgi:hypothetical protein